MDVITISGLDGSGKSTQIALLRERFEGEGRRVYYFHAVHFSIAERLRGRGSGSGADQAEKPGVTSASTSSILLRRVFLRIDLVRFRGLLRKLERQGFDVVLSDRYYYDNVVNIAYLSRTDRLRSVAIPRPTHCFYLRVEPETIMTRGRAPEQGVEYLTAKQRLYDRAATRFDLTVIDGSKSESAVASNLARHGIPSVE